MDGRLLSKGLILGLLSPGSMMAHAGAAGGNGCGWGNIVFEGQRSLFPYLLATTTNGTLGNAAFGMTSRTNDCNANARPGYGDHSIFAMNGMLGNTAENTAKGQGEALDAYTVLLDVEAKDWARFAQVTWQHFSEIFASKDATGEQILSNTLTAMNRDGALICYAKQPAWDFRPRKEPITASFFVCAACPPGVVTSVATVDERLGHTVFPRDASYGEGKAAPRCFRLAGRCRPWISPTDSCDIAPTAIVR